MVASMDGGGHLRVLNRVSDGGNRCTDRLTLVMTLDSTYQHPEGANPEVGIYIIATKEEGSLWGYP